MSSLRSLFKRSSASIPTRASDAKAIALPRTEARGSPRLTHAQWHLTSEIAAHNAAGRYAEALSLATRALSAGPDDADLLVSRGSTLFAWGRFREARADFSKAAASGAENVGLYLHLGWSCYHIGELNEGEAWMHRVLASDPEAWQAHFVLGAIHQARKKLEEALSSYARGIELCPGDVQAYVMSGICKLDQGDPVGAEAFFRRAIAVDDRSAIAWANLGVALGSQDRFDEAFAPFTHAVRLEQEGSEACDSFVNFATNLREVGRTREAFALYEESLVDRPSVTGLGDYALALLTDGQFAKGWELYEFRWLKEPFLSLRPGFRKPVWTGQDLHGKTILLCGEQGFGDIIQFIRYAPMLKSLGATVFLRMRSGLEPLAAGFPGVDRILDRDSVLPPFDFHIHLMSLPRAFGTELASIPADIPYLRADSVRGDRWVDRLRAVEELKVGVIWAGNPAHARDRFRSMSLERLMPLLNVDGARFYSLQKGPAAAEIEALQLSDIDLVDLGPLLDDFGETVAVIEQLDLVVCVDTAIAHLAGALGKPVWLLLPQPADFRWLEGREDSPWYPTMRLFRQSRRGKWDDVVERVKAALVQRVSAGESHLTLPATPSRPKSPEPLPRAVPRLGGMPGHQPGLAAVAECRYGILQYLPDEELIGGSLGWYGEYLQPQVDLLSRLIRPGSTVLEVGAGVGAHTLPLAAAVGETGHVFLYESRPVLQRILRQNLGANRITNITVMRRSLGGPRAFDADSSSGLSQSAEAPRGGPIGDVTETIDELQLEGLNWLKINATVPALAVLDGAAQALWRLRPLLFIGTLDQPSTAAPAARIQEFSYRCWQMETPLFSPKNFNGYDTDIFAGRAARALLAIPEEIEVDVALEGCIELT